MGESKRSGLNAFADAVAVWHMADSVDSSGNGNNSIAKGDVKLGVQLTGADLEESLRRGGDGRAAVFNSGYLSVGDDSEHRLDITGQEMSLCLRIRNTEGIWSGPLIGKFGGDRKASYYLACIDGAKKPMFSFRNRGNKARTPFFDLFSEEAGPKKITGTKSCIEFVWGAEPDRQIVEGLEREDVGDPLISEARSGVMKVSYPVALIEPDEWHDIIVRFTGPKLQLFIDGVLVDEEFPIGEMRSSATPFLIGAASQDGEIVSGFKGLVDHAALWDRALTDEEIEFLSGGKEVVVHRDSQILGTESDRMQYWRPRGHNTRAGDCMPFFHDGVYHLYFLVVRRNHHGKWQAGHGGLEIWHSSTRDLIHWEHHPVAIPITEQWEKWWGTGSFVYHEGTYYTMQKVPHMWEKHSRGIRLATSKDGIHFAKNETYPYLEGEDVDIYRDENTGIFHLLTGKDRKPGDRPTIKRYFSRNLLDWEEAEEPFIVTEPRHVVNICPHLFKWKEWYYFFGGFTERSGVWKSRNQFGPWTLQEPEKLDLLAVPKTAEYPGGRRIFAGFLEDHGWGGNLVFRDLVQNEDGSLGTKFPPEMIPSSGNPMELTLKPLTTGVSGDSSSVRIKASEAVELGMLEGTESPIAKNARISLFVKPGSTAKVFGLFLRGRNRQERGFELKFEPDRRRVQFAVAETEGLSADSPLCSEDVAGLSEPFGLDIIIKDDIIDVCIDDRRTMVARYWNPESDKVMFFGREAEVSFDSVQIRPLTEK